MHGGEYGSPGTCHGRSGGQATTLPGTFWPALPLVDATPPGVPARVAPGRWAVPPGLLGSAGAPWPGSTPSCGTYSAPGAVSSVDTVPSLGTLVGTKIDMRISSTSRAARGP